MIVAAFCAGMICAALSGIMADCRMSNSALAFGIVAFICVFACVVMTGEKGHRP